MKDDKYITKEMIKKVQHLLSDFNDGLEIIKFLRETEPVFMSEVCRFSESEMERFRGKLDGEALYSLGSVIGAACITGYLINNEKMHEIYEKLINLDSLVKEIEQETAEDYRFKEGGIGALETYNFTEEELSQLENIVCEENKNWSKRRTRLCKIVAPVWEKLKKIEDKFYGDLQELEKEMEKVTGIEGIEFFFCDNSIVGIGNADRTMELIHRDDLLYGAHIQANKGENVSIKTYSREEIEHSEKTIKELADKGWDLVGTENQEKGIEYFNEVLSMDNNNIDALTGIARVMSDLGRFQESLDYYTKINYLDPTNIEAWVDKGVVHKGQKNYEEAMKCFEGAIMVKPENCHARWAKAILLYDLGKYEESLKCCNEALEISPSFWMIREYKSDLLRKLGRHDEAKACMEEGKMYRNQ